MKTLYKIVVSAAVALLPITSIAQSSDHSFSANATMASDYLFRGQSQTDNGPTIQGGFDYGHSSGLYLGTWAS
ncbi:MAG: TorF family putative porin, partial [Gammaproteobacteria bacterium]